MSGMTLYNYAQIVLLMLPSTPPQFFAEMSCDSADFVAIQKSQTQIDPFWQTIGQKHLMDETDAYTIEYVIKVMT